MRDPSDLCLPDGYGATCLGFLDRMGTDGLCFLGRLHGLRIILMKGHGELQNQFLPTGVNGRLDC